ncbi:MAG: capsular biosynthesis protein CpsI, partial [Hyphomicrobiales bacterium]
PDWNSDHPDPASSSAPFRVYNIGNNQPVSLLAFIEEIEKCLGRRAVKNLLPLQDGDVPQTYADIEALQAAVGFTPNTPIDVGIGKFIDWYRGYNGPR